MVELFINDTLIDSAIDEPMALTFAFDDIDNLEQSNNSASKSIALPATAQVRRFFRFAEDVNVTNFQGQKTDLKSVVKEDGIEIFSGVVNLLSIQQNAAQ